MGFDVSDLCTQEMDSFCMRESGMGFFHEDREEKGAETVMCKGSSGYESGMCEKSTKSDVAPYLRAPGKQWGLREKSIKLRDFMFGRPGQTPLEFGGPEVSKAGTDVVSLSFNKKAPG